MKPNKQNITGLYLISDTAFSNGRGHEEIVEAGLLGGASVVQIREKTLTLRELYPIAARIRQMTAAAGAVLIINDSVELAMAVGADGVHLGQGDFPVNDARRLLGADKIIGVSTHSLSEALKARDDGADYIGFGPMFPTETKDAGDAKEPDELRLIREKVDMPIVAIGGINASNGGPVIEAGADALAVISAVVGADDIETAARGIAALFVQR